MRADRPLWIDADEMLCDAPPASGFKIASAEGVNIPNRVVDKYGLALEGGVVMQNGEVRTPEQPARIIADRELFADAAGVLYDEPQSTGIKVADAGKRIPIEYVRRYQLSIEDGIVVQTSAPGLDELERDDTEKPKEARKAPNKARKPPANKGARGSGGLTVPGRDGPRSSGGAS
tara:strand:+ start:376 stop:900 length:525 start_codon:yes stop_codon:yes gene_type:complete